MDPVTTKDVVLSEKPLISEETDLIEPALLDELICHICSLASVYHTPPMSLWKEVMGSIADTCQYTMGALMLVTALLAPPQPPTWSSLRLFPLKVTFWETFKP